MVLQPYLRQEYPSVCCTWQAVGRKRRANAQVRVNWSPSSAAKASCQPLRHSGTVGAGGHTHRLGLPAGGGCQVQGATSCPVAQAAGCRAAFCERPGGDALGACLLCHQLWDREPGAGTAREAKGRWPWSTHPGTARKQLAPGPNTRARTVAMEASVGESRPWVRAAWPLMTPVW